MSNILQIFWEMKIETQLYNEAEFIWNMIIFLNMIYTIQTETWKRKPDSLKSINALLVTIDITDKANCKPYTENNSNIHGLKIDSGQNREFLQTVF